MAIHVRPLRARIVPPVRRRLQRKNEAYSALVEDRPGAANVESPDQGYPRRSSSVRRTPRLPATLIWNVI